MTMISVPAGPGLGMRYPQHCQMCARKPGANRPWCRTCQLQDGAPPTKFQSAGTYRTGHDVYIAGPFFNPEQMAVIEGIEKTLTSLGVSYFSPVREGGLVANVPDEVSAEVFCIDYMGIVHCHRVLAICTYEGADLWRTVGGADYYTPDQPNLNMFPVKLSDTGTVWEMGAAFDLDRPVIGYFPEGQLPAKMNLMLTECFVDIVHGLEELELYFTGHKEETRWAGSIQ